MYQEQVFCHEPPRDLPIRADVDVIVAGGGPAGVAAAVAAARVGARVLLLEHHGFLGGVWTAGALSWIIDHENKTGFMAELLRRLMAAGGRARNSAGEWSSGYDVETMKVELDAVCAEAGVRTRLHTRLVAALRDPTGKRLTHVITESRSGREAWSAKVFVDCTGDGDLAARAGCGYDMGHPQTRAVQPMTLMALFTGVDPAVMRNYTTQDGLPWGVPHNNLLSEIRRAGIEPSYAHPVFFRVSDRLYAMMCNHIYGVHCDDADGVTRASIQARSEVMAIARGLRSLGGTWSNLTLVATGSQIGVREGRRIHGLYTVTADDLRHGARHPDAVCRATFCVDLHSPDPRKNKGVSDEGIKALPYDIPLRALIARDVDGLLMAGRCISGDFISHSSYRVTGNAVALGEAAGVCAALAAERAIAPREVPYQDVLGTLEQVRNRQSSAPAETPPTLHAV